MRTAWALGLVVALAAAVIIGIGLLRYSGSALVFLLFNGCCLALVALVFPRPRLYAYTFLAIFLAMGFWAKTLLHWLSPRPFLEPVGAFADTPPEWDRALLAMSAALLGMIVVRVAHLWHRGRHRVNESSVHAPGWYGRRRGFVWIATFAAIVIVNAANLHLAFFQIGVNPKALLPLRLHIVAAWLVNIGFALWIATLIGWQRAAAPRGLRVGLLAPLVEACVSATSSFSRIVYLVHGVPYCFALWERRRELADAIGRRYLLAFAGAFVVLLAAATVAVFALRLHYYPLIDRTTGAAGSADIGSNMARELPQLIVHRWVGLEGVLTAGAASDRGWSLLVAALTDSPKRGAQSLYQQIAKLTPYRTDPKAFTFLTNAGPVAILHLSGSLAVVLLGMAIIAGLLIATEEAAQRWTGNPFLLAVSGAALANVVAQTTFFYLTAIFFAQLWLALAVVAGLQRLRS